MMESNFYSDEFEQLIRGKTEQYKMYPSEKVWKGVYSSLHAKKRWFIAGMSLLVTGIILLAGKELILPSAHPGAAKKQALVANLNTPKTAPEIITLPAAFTEYRGNSHPPAAHNGQAPAPLQDEDLPAPDPANSIGRISEPVDASGVPTVIAKGSASGTDEAVPDAAAGSHAAISHASAHANDPSAQIYFGYLARVRTGNGLSAPDPFEGSAVRMNLATAQGDVLTPGLQIPLHATTAKASARRIQRIADEAETISPVDASTSAHGAGTQRINWLQEYAVANMHSSSRKKISYWQLYFAPTVNTRTLSGGNNNDAAKSGNTAATPLPPLPSTNTGIKSLLTDIGFEGGGSLLYKLNRTLSVKAGLQFNYSRFAIVDDNFLSIAASSAPSAASSGQAPAPTAANTAASVITADPNSGAITSGSLNHADQGPAILDNQYYQLSVPVGLELRVWGNDRLQVNIATTVQPTYLLNTDGYLLATDYSHYTKDPSQFRKWNLNLGAEAYVSYKIGGLRLQVGPEFRYQAFSSYSTQYPIRENLQQYGLKIGITKAIR